jgi:chorismate lyase/3-hydroxybenzoate synthase
MPKPSAPSLPHGGACPAAVASDGAPDRPVLRFASCSGLGACRRCIDADDFLGGAAFGSVPVAGGPGLPLARVPVAVLSGEAAEGELWRGSAPVAGGADAARGLVWRHDGAFLFGVIRLAEGGFAGVAGKTPLQAATEAAYRSLFELIDGAGYRHLLRCWNYLADINGESEGLERYRQFNIGRQDAFLAHARETVGSVPAACALGTPAGDLLVFFLASRHAAQPVENPRQVSAYRYPADYGPRPPTFARATIVPLAERPLLLISGTASIVGHQTVHAGDVCAQTRESLANIAAVVAEAAQQSGREFRLGDLDYRVYLRHADDLAAARATIAEHFAAAGLPAGGAPHVVCMQADVCRRDLLVEIEATGYAAA